MSCEDWVIDSAYFYKFVISRSKDGTVTMYINGVKCAEGNPTARNAFALDLDDLQLMQDDVSSYATAGAVREIQVWGKALNQTELSAACDCPSPVMSTATCGAATLFVATVNDIDFSSTRHRDDFDGYYGKGYSLSDAGGQWSPGTNREGAEWMQVDLGEVTDIAGVVTKGSWNNNWQVDTYVVRVSDDQVTWTGVDCAKVVQTQYTSSADRRDKPYERYFSAPVRARYLRLYPLQFTNYPSMRMQVLTCVPPGEWWTCASEGGTCRCDGDVRYGAGSSWSDDKTVSGSFPCSNAEFGGDPVPGVAKSCQCKEKKEEEEEKKKEEKKRL
jgi:hypothetical protein